MQTDSLYEKYYKQLIDIVGTLSEEVVSQNSISQDERNAVSIAENNYKHDFDVLAHAKKAAQDQYSSIWDSCAQDPCFKRPRDQRPAPTDLPWKNAIMLQEQAASRIKDWFTEKSKQAFIERQKKIKEEEARQAALEAARAEEARLKAEKEAFEKRQQGESLIEALKRKHRKQ